MFPDSLRGAAARVQARLQAALADLPGEPVVEAMRHALRGGKGLRGFLVIEGARLHGVEPDEAVFAAAAVEALHAYSLVHDDLPAMDDDDLRRGRPTVHRKWDEPTAILAGDALQALAFELLAAEADCPAETRVRLIAGRARAAETAPAPLTLAEITALQEAKTGALIGWAAEAGALLGDADPAPLKRFARALGLAFQIADDILDVAGDAERAGKRLRKDAAAGKATFVSLLGLEGARARANELVTEAELALAPYGPAADTLREAARFAIARDN